MEDAGGQRRRYVNVGAGREFDPVYASLTHGRVLGTGGYADVGEPWNLVLSADVELRPAWCWPATSPTSTTISTAKPATRRATAAGCG